jgi:hypothetical protein
MEKYIIENLPIVLGVLLFMIVLVAFFRVIAEQY